LLGDAKVRAESYRRLLPARLRPRPDALERTKASCAKGSGLERPGSFYERMKRIVSARTQSATAVILALTTLIVCLPAPARANRKVNAREQFERAVKMRTTLEGNPQKDRSLSDYRQTIGAYHNVYLISPQAEEVTPSLIAEGELYQEMGRYFDPKYFKSAIDTYNFLLKQYPGSRYRSEALFSIGRIQKEYLDRPDDAEATFKDFLRRFPKSGKADGAREALKEIADAREDQRQQEAEAKAAQAAEAAQEAQAEKRAKEKDPVPAIKGEIAQQREATGRTPHVTDIRTWNAPDHTRIVVTLEDTIKFDASRIAAPDRIYFDLYKANLTPALAKRILSVDNGLLKSVRLAQNKLGVVRLVLDVDGAKDYSAFLLSHPYRLVIDVHAASANAIKPSPIAPAKIEEAKSDPKPAARPAESVSVTAENKQPPKPDVKSSAQPVSAKPKPNASKAAALQPPTEPKPNRDGQRSLTRALGL